MFEAMTNLLRYNNSFTGLFKPLNVQERCRRKLQKYYSSKWSKPPVLYDKDDHITLIGLNRPNSRNTVDSETAKCLSEAISSFEADRSSPVAVIYGMGGSLCAGQDLTDLENKFRNNDLKEDYNAFCNHGLFRKHSQKPIVCGINGYCVADGLELALFCDLRVMEDTAILGFFGRPAGLHLKCGGSARLPSLIGYSRSLDLLLTGRRVCAKEALQIGLANRIVATGTALGQAVHLAFSIAKFPIEALQRDRENVYLNNYERRKGIRQAMKNETAPIGDYVKSAIRDSLFRCES
ncbi:putative enoyl-CoA hydratase/isomerase YngF isoform X2 [Eurosta solidaginis]